MPSTATTPTVAPPQDSPVARLLIAPLTFISFLISLALIDSHNASLRSSPNGQRPSFLHRILYRDSEPYAYVKSPYKEGGAAGDAKSASPGSKGADEPWHWNTKQRKMMKMEISDAFEIRRWVLAGLLVCGCLLGMLAWFVTRYVVGYLWS